MKNSDKIRALPPLMPNAAMRWDVVSRIPPARLGDVLEIGCGQGAVAARLARLADSLTAIEPDSRSFEVARRRVGANGTVLNATSSDLPASQQFDTICAFEVLEHIEDDRAALAEWIGHLRPGGTLLISVPAFEQRFSHADSLAGHFRRYDRPGMTALLADSGLTDIEVRLYGFPGGYLLEAGRNLMARRLLAKSVERQGYAERTASSGRLFQPGNRLSGILINAVTIPMIIAQRLFPDRGIGMVAKARLPG